MEHKFRKKMLALVTAIALIVSFGSLAMAAAADTGFTDVAADAWYAGAVAYVKDNGLMSGTTATAFEPETATSRAMLVSILHRQAGSPQAQAADFRDVTDSAWYRGAADWASANGIVSGYTDGRFGPEDPVTREQIAVILWHAAGSPEPAGTAAAFADQTEISAYAVSAVGWAQTNGIVSGKENNHFDPSGLATRAETAAILQNYLGKSGGNSSSGDKETPRDSHNHYRGRYSNSGSLEQFLLCARSYRTPAADRFHDPRVRRLLCQAGQPLSL